MSQENVDALRHIYAAWADGNFEVGQSVYDPFLVYIGQRGDSPDPDPGPHYGLETVNQLHAPIPRQLG